MDIRDQIMEQIRREIKAEYAMEKAQGIADDPNPDIPPSVVQWYHSPRPNYQQVLEEKQRQEAERNAMICRNQSNNWLTHPVAAAQRPAPPETPVSHCPHPRKLIDLGLF